MKRLSLIALLVVVMAGNGLAATVGTWYGALDGDLNHAVGTGHWEDLYWNTPAVYLPPGPGTSGDEVKIIRDGTVCTLATNVGNYNWTMTLGSLMTGGAAARMEIVPGGYLGMREVRIGGGGTTGSATITGYLDQTGGTLTVYNDGDIIVGRMGNAATKNGVGYYTISGGTITYDSLTTTTKGRLYVGGASGTEGMNGATGAFTVMGDDASITMKKLYVGAQTATRYGAGTLEFKIDAGGVSPIRLTDADSIILDQAGANSMADLIISLTAAPPAGNILLIENTNTGAVSGLFDSLNGGSALEGAPVILSYGENTYNYSLTYAGGIGGNDIVLIPEPATLALLGLGGLIVAARRPRSRK